MRLYNTRNNKIEPITEKPFRLERDLQRLFEENLNQITILRFVSSEFTVKSFRLDTLAFDEESKSFVIIEYKRSQNISVVDQGMSYLRLMLDDKANFILEYNEKCNQYLRRADVDWSQSKVIFVAPNFNNYQRQAANLKDFPIELWEVQRYNSDILVINQLKKSSSSPSIKEVQTTSVDSSINKVIQTIKTYTENEHLEGKPDEIKELYEDFKTAILNLDPNIEVEPKKMYIAFKKGGNIVDIRIQQKTLILWINRKKGELEDPKHLTSDASNKGCYGNGDYELRIEDTADLEYIMSLIKQAL